jgi:hypothetical protein
LTCYYCALRHPKVEAGGVWHCPNFACSGPGGATHRMKLKSCTDVGDNRHSVDEQEWHDAAVEYANNLPFRERELAERIMADAAKIISVRSLSERLPSSDSPTP